MSECIICQKKINKGEFCEYHELAKKNVYETYNYWKEAYGGLSFKDYLIKLKEHKYSGKWVKEVANYLLENEKF